MDTRRRHGILEQDSFCLTRQLHSYLVEYFYLWRKNGKLLHQSWHIRDSCKNSPEFRLLLTEFLVLNLEKISSAKYIPVTKINYRDCRGSRLVQQHLCVPAGISKRFSAKLRAYKMWLKKNRTLSTPEIIERTIRKLRGHYGYYGVTDNSKGINAFYYEVKGILYKWLNRRGKKGCYSWEKFAKLLARYPLPLPRIMVTLF